MFRGSSQSRAAEELPPAGNKNGNRTAKAGDAKTTPKQGGPAAKQGGSAAKQGGSAAKQGGPAAKGSPGETGTERPAGAEWPAGHQRQPEVGQPLVRKGQVEWPTPRQALGRSTRPSPPRPPSSVSVQTRSTSRSSRTPSRRPSATSAPPPESGSPPLHPSLPSAVPPPAQLSPGQPPSAPTPDPRRVPVLAPPRDPAPIAGSVVAPGVGEGPGSAADVADGAGSTAAVPTRLDRERTPPPPPAPSPAPLPSQAPSPAAATTRPPPRRRPPVTPSRRRTRPWDRGNPCSRSWPRRSLEPTLAAGASPSPGWILGALRRGGSRQLEPLVAGDDHPSCAEHRPPIPAGRPGRNQLLKRPGRLKLDASDDPSAPPARSPAPLPLGTSSPVGLLSG